jgi:hypothetical protein
MRRRVRYQTYSRSCKLTCVEADDLIDRNRLLLARAEAARVRKRLVVEEIAEPA